MTLLNPVPKSSTGTLATTSPLSGGGPMSGNVTVGLTLSNARNYLRGDGTWQTRPWFYTRDYGAVGDGTTDDTAAVQAAIDAAIAVNGRVIVHGICSVDTLTITSSILIEGEHGPATYFNNGFLGHYDPSLLGSCLKSRSGGTILKYTGQGHHFGGVRNIRFSGGTPIVWLLMTEDVQQWVMDSVVFEDCTGLLFDNSNADLINHYGTCYQFTWKNIQLIQCQKGMKITGGPACTIIGYYIDAIGNNASGIDFNNGNLHLIGYNSGYEIGYTGPLTGGNTGACLVVSGTQVLVENSTFEGWYDSAVKWDGTGQLAFKNCWFRDTMVDLDPTMQQIAINITGPASGAPILIENCEFISTGWRYGTPVVQTSGSAIGAAMVMLYGMDDQLENLSIPGVYLDSTSAIRPTSYIRSEAITDAGGTVRQAIKIPYLTTSYQPVVNTGAISLAASGTLTSGNQTFRANAAAAYTFPATDMGFPSGGKHVVGEVDLLGTKDVIVQAIPGSTAGYGYFEAWNSAGLVLGTGNVASAPVLIKPNRTVIASFAGDVGASITWKNDAWHSSYDSKNRFYFGANAQTYIKSGIGAASTVAIEFRNSADGTLLQVTGNGDLKVIGNVGFNGAAPLAKPTITGSRGGNAALASIATALATYGLVTDSTTA